MRAPTRSTVAMGAALAGLALAAFATFRTARYPAAPPRADDAATQAELVRLRAQVETLGRAVAHLRATSAPAAAPAVDGLPAATGAPTAPVDDEPAAAAPTPPTYRAFEAPRGVVVTTAGSGLAVRNTDPSLTGQVVTVTGERDDGERELLTIVVPAPE